MTPRQTRNRRNAFTLLELLIVVGIVAALVAVTTLVGTAVINTGKKRATLGVLQSLDEALAAYIDKKGTIPPALVEVPVGQLPTTVAGEMPSYNGTQMTGIYPALDGVARDDNTNEMAIVNSVGLFIESAKAVPEAQEVINSINTRYIRTYTANEDQQPVLLTAFDAWDNPIRYVHPKFDGIIEREPRSLGDAGEPINYNNPAKGFFTPGALPPSSQWVRLRMKAIRRNRLVDADYGDGGRDSGGGLNQQSLSDFDLIPDSDGGLTQGNRPYFYSAGPDGDPSTIEDNIYISPVQHADPGVEN
jgi:prepilin-type N-terminal cleavage/methylation domain-containing protein